MENIKYYIEVFDNGVKNLRRAVDTETVSSREHIAHLENVEMDRLKKMCEDLGIELRIVNL
jgi:hypothetical protein